MTSFLIWNVGIPSDNISVQNPRVQNIRKFIDLQDPDICVLQDAFNISTPEESIESLFPKYTIYSQQLQEQGDDKIRRMSYCVLIKKNYSQEVYVEAVDIGNTRYAIELTFKSFKMLVSYLEYANHRIRREQLMHLLYLTEDIDIVCGDLNTIFCDVRKEYFGNIFQMLTHWKQIGLYIVHPVVRNMHVSRKILARTGWSLASRNKKSFPLTCFWDTFLNSNPILQLTGWIWKTIFDQPVLAPDHVLTKDPDIFRNTPFLITTTGGIEYASDHGAIFFEV